MSTKDSIWEYVVIVHPTRTAQKGGARAEILVDPKVCIAKDADECKVIALRGLKTDVPTDRVEVAVRPFCA